MSRESERKAMRETLSEYTLMKVGELARFLRCTDTHARDILKAGLIPSVNIGLGVRAEYRVDPLDAAVFRMAKAAGQTTEEYWEEHGEETVTHARRLVTRIRKLVA